MADWAEQQRIMRLRRRGGGVPGGTMKSGAALALRAVAPSWPGAGELMSPAPAMLPGTTQATRSLARAAGSDAELSSVPGLAAQVILPAPVRSAFAELPTPPEVEKLGRTSGTSFVPGSDEQALRELQRTGAEILQIVLGLERQEPGPAVAAP